jgi:hypothetical protein
MDFISNMNVENLAKLILNKFQKKALDDATEKELKGKSVFHSWEDTKRFVRDRSEK